MRRFADAASVRGLATVFTRASALVLAGVLLAACGGGPGGDQTPLPTCPGNQVILDNGQCGPPPTPECEAPEVAVGGRCIVPDKPTPKYVPGPNEAVVYYNRRDQNFSGWVLHLWNNGCEAGSWDAERVTLRGPDGAVDYSYEGSGTSWPDGPPPNYQHYLDGGIDPIYGAYWVLQLQENGVCGNFIIHAEGGAPQTVDLRINFSEDAANPYRNMYWVVVDSTLAENELREARAAAEPLCINDVCAEFEAPPLAVEDQAAHWIDSGTILWDRQLANVQLYGSADGALEVAAEEQDDGSTRGVVVGGELAATLAPIAIGDAQAARVPHLAAYSAYAMDLPIARVKELLAQQLWIVGEDAAGNQFGTQLQLARVLDAVYTAGSDDADEAALGPVYANGEITASVWAPTAQDVKLRLYDTRADGALVFNADLDMALDSETGIWRRAASVGEWDGRYYRYVVTAYHPSEWQVLAREARDPYSVSAYTGSLASQFVDVAAAEFKPEGWDAELDFAPLPPERAVVYEGHIRDFSARDESTPQAHRGKYLAFASADSAPVTHLKQLAAAGVTHFHVLPTFDVRSINEDPAQQVNLRNAIFELCRLDDSNKELCPGDVRDTTTILEKLQDLDPTTDAARKVITAIADLDGYNWGYDPVLYNVPEGSYATDPRGPARIRELRAMIQALHGMGLRVVMDVVYNHTSDEGADGSFSVFDRIVPGYYYRRNATTGGVERASDMPSPLHSPADAVALGEGNTPSAPLRALGYLLGLEALYAKLEFMNPTGSFKDRGTAALMSVAKEFGAREVVEDSSGNAGASVAAYAARAGIAAHIFAPASAPAAKLSQISVYGATAHLIEGSRQAATDAAMDFAAARRTCLCLAQPQPVLLRRNQDIRIRNRAPIRRTDAQAYRHPRGQRIAAHRRVQGF